MINRKIKEQIKIANGFKCKRCGSKKNLSVDHVIPVSEGGTDDPSNLVILCVSCNRLKANTPPFWLNLKLLLRGDWFKFKNEVKGMLASRFTDLKVEQATQDRNTVALTNKVIELNKTVLLQQARIDKMALGFRALADRQAALMQHLGLTWQEGISVHKSSPQELVSTADFIHKNLA